jgi:hypothetical protein
MTRISGTDLYPGLHGGDLPGTVAGAVAFLTQRGSP